jgi:hypothetical protein
VRTRKLLLMAVTNTPLAAYGIYNQYKYIARSFSSWNPPTSLAENIRSLQLVLTTTRLDLDTDEFYGKAVANTAIFTPLIGFYVFAWFGCGAEARKTYREGLLQFGCLINVVGILPFSGSAMALRRISSRRGPLPLVQPSAPHITPYITPPREPGLQPPASSARAPRSNPVGGLIDKNRRPPIKDPVPRRSIHKPPFLPGGSANATASTTTVVPNPPARRLSCHKPVFVPVDTTNTTPVITSDPPGSIPLVVADVSNVRRQGEFASRPIPRYLSCHKPDFVPLVPANPKDKILDAGGIVIPPYACSGRAHEQQGPRVARRQYNGW